MARRIEHLFRAEIEHQHRCLPSPSVTREDAPCATPPSAAPRPPRCNAAWWTGWHAPANPGSSADRPRPPADASRTNAAAHAASRAPAARTAAGTAAASAAPPPDPAARRARPGTAGCPAARSGCSASQAPMASRTAGSTGTIRSLLPLPTTRSMPSEPGSGASRTFSASASAMRSPQPYSSTNSAVSRAWIAAASDISPIRVGDRRAPDRAPAPAAPAAWHAASRSTPAPRSPRPAAAPGTGRTSAPRTAAARASHCQPRWPHPPPAMPAHRPAAAPPAPARSGSPPRCCVRKPRNPAISAPYASTVSGARDAPAPAIRGRRRAAALGPRPATCVQRPSAAPQRRGRGTPAVPPPAPDPARADPAPAARSAPAGPSPGTRTSAS